MENVVILLDEILEANEIKQKLEGLGYRVPYIVSTFEELVKNFK